MGDLLLDLLLPKTDRIVAIQWVVCTIVWVSAIWLVRKQDRDIRHFVIGLAVANLAWFAFRAVH